MIILSQDGERLVDAGEVTYNETTPDEHHVYVMIDIAYSFGEYETKARCLEVIEEIADRQCGIVTVYKMPKE